MVIVALAVRPSEMPSVGVTFTDQRSALTVALLGSTEEVLAVETTPFWSHSYRYVTAEPSGSTLGVVMATVRLSVVVGADGAKATMGCDGIPLTLNTVCAWRQGHQSRWLLV